MAQDAQLLYTVGWDLANSAEWPNWSDDSEFRATRDQSASDRGAAPSQNQLAPAPKHPAKGERG